MNRTHSLCALALVAVACKDPEPQIPHDPSKPEVGVKADVGRGPVAPRPAPAVAERDAEGWPPRVHEVARGDGGLGVFELRSGALFVTAGPRVLPVSADGSLDTSKRWLRGIDPTGEETIEGWEIRTLGGTTPGALFITEWRSSPDYPYRAYRWTGERWRKLLAKSPNYFSNPRRLAMWRDGAVLSHRQFDPRPDAPPTLGEVDGERTARAVIAETKPLTVVAGARRAPDVERFDDFDALPSGELFLLRGAVIEHRNTDAVGRQRTLPDAEGLLEASLVLESSDRAYAYGGLERDDSVRPYLARWNGDAWVREAAPPCDAALVDLSWSASHGTWAICRTDWSANGGAHPGSVFGRKRDDGAWVLLPEVGDRAHAVIASEKHGLWIATEATVFGPKPAAVFEAPQLNEALQ